MKRLALCLAFLLFHATMVAADRCAERKHREDAA